MPHPAVKSAVRGRISSRLSHRPSGRRGL